MQQQADYGGEERPAQVKTEKGCKRKKRTFTSVNPGGGTLKANVEAATIYCIISKSWDAIKLFPETHIGI